MMGDTPHNEPYYEPPPMPLDPAQLEAVKQLMGHGIDAETACAAVAERVEAALLCEFTATPEVVPAEWAAGRDEPEETP
jgi:hypothetical protein